MRQVVVGLADPAQTHIHPPVLVATEKPTENTLTIRKVGEAHNTFYMPKYAGVDPETGEAMWYKAQEGGDEKTKNVNEAGQRIVGSADPKFYGGFGMNFKYKGFDFFDTSFTFKNKVYNSGLHLICRLDIVFRPGI